MRKFVIMLYLMQYCHNIIMHIIKYINVVVVPPLTVNAFLILSGQNKDRNKHCLTIIIYIHPVVATPAPPASVASCILYNEIITYFRVFYDVEVVKICITRLNNSQVRARAARSGLQRWRGTHLLLQPHTPTLIDTTTLSSPAVH